MKLLTRFELAAKNQNELHSYLREAFNELARSEPDTHQCRNALASIENIQNELAGRAPGSYSTDVHSKRQNLRCGFFLAGALDTLQVVSSAMRIARDDEPLPAICALLGLALTEGPKGLEL